MNIKNKKTERGFVRIEFEDYNGESCSLQESSLADDRCIWLGVNKVTPKIMARDAPDEWRLPPGHPERMNGWVDVPLPAGALTLARMHLTREQLAALMPYFVYFIENGELPEIPQEET